MQCGQRLAAAGFVSFKQHLPIASGNAAGMGFFPAKDRGGLDDLLGYYDSMISTTLCCETVHVCLSQKWLAVEHVGLWFKGA